jgi:hypothetical protein
MQAVPLANRNVDRIILLLYVKVAASELSISSISANKY